jgi:hypothetical protein
MAPSKVCVERDERNDYVTEAILGAAFGMLKAGPSVESV